MTTYEVEPLPEEKGILYMQFSQPEGRSFKSNRPTWEEQVKDIQEQLNSEHIQIKLITKKTNKK